MADDIRLKHILEVYTKVRLNDMIDVHDKDKSFQCQPSKSMDYEACEVAVWQQCGGQDYNGDKLVQLETLAFLSMIGIPNVNQHLLLRTALLFGLNVVVQATTLTPMAKHVVMKINVKSGMNTTGNALPNKINGSRSR
ncbi:hypothetical protein THRCLA_21362 [Thraustotheca clavata]|uniref:Uncharacterized protein n=1 Tax=Thraustotheca clavata TaxID=74557 RepID=A0A1V9ZXC3_9STRA|nr:hypothetical protein THRCLA_21362 [Thraustotheca clavata]